MAYQPAAGTFALQITKQLESNRMNVRTHDDVTLVVEQAVRERYSKGAVQREAALCCPVEYDKKYLAA
ncbi:MAG: hypothetical protein AAB344_02190, partial [Bacteroidota bacterium]